MINIRARAPTMSVGAKRRGLLVKQRFPITADGASVDHSLCVAFVRYSPRSGRSTVGHVTGTLCGRRLRRVRQLQAGGHDNRYSGRLSLHATNSRRSRLLCGIPLAHRIWDVFRGISATVPGGASCLHFCLRPPQVVLCENCSRSQVNHHRRSRRPLTNDCPVCSGHKLLDTLRESDRRCLDVRCKCICDKLSLSGMIATNRRNGLPRLPERTVDADVVRLFAFYKHPGLVEDGSVWSSGTDDHSSLSACSPIPPCVCIR